MTCTIYRQDDKMKMPFAQYQRIETIAEGIGCTRREFIAAAHTRLSPLGRSRSQREARQAWLRDGLETLDRMRKQACGFYV